MTEHPERCTDQEQRLLPGAYWAFLEHRRNRTTKVVRSVCRCGQFASAWVLSPEIAVQAGRAHTRQVAHGTGGPP